MAFLADVALADVRPPEFSLGGRTYRGVFLSHSEWQSWSRRFVEAHQDGRPEVLAHFYYALTDACFPRPWWKLWATRVADLVAALPLVVQLQAVEDFCSSQAIANGYAAPPTRPALGKKTEGATTSPRSPAASLPAISPLASSAATAPAPTGAPPSPPATGASPPPGTTSS